MPRISSLRSSRDGTGGTSLTIGAAALHWPTASSITSRNPGKASSICARSIPPCNKLRKYAMSGDDAASGLGDVRSASNAGSRAAAASSSAGVSSRTGRIGTGSCSAGCKCARVTLPVGFARIQRSTTARTSKHPCAVIAATLVAKSPLFSISRSNAATQPSRAADRSLSPAGSPSNVMRLASFGMQSRPSPSKRHRHRPGRSVSIS